MRNQAFWNHTYSNKKSQDILDRKEWDNSQWKTNANKLSYVNLTCRKNLKI